MVTASAGTGARTSVASRPRRRSTKETLGPPTRRCSSAIAAGEGSSMASRVGVGDYLTSPAALRLHALNKDLSNRVRAPHPCLRCRPRYRRMQAIATAAERNAPCRTTRDAQASCRVSLASRDAPARIELALGLELHVRDDASSSVLDLANRLRVYCSTGSVH